MGLFGYRPPKVPLEGTKRPSHYIFGVFVLKLSGCIDDIELLDFLALFAFICIISIILMTVFNFAKILGRAPNGK